VEQIIKLLTDINFWTAVGAIGAVLAAVIPWYLHRNSTKEQLSSKLEQRKIEKYDRHYSKIKELQEIIRANPLPSPSGTVVTSLQGDWVRTTQTLKLWYDKYAVVAELFDEDLRNDLSSSVSEYDAAYSEFRASQDSQDAIARTLTAASRLSVLLPETVDKQAERLAKI
jgi:hypothetical protein